MWTLLFAIGNTKKAKNRMVPGLSGTARQQNLRNSCMLYCPIGNIRTNSGIGPDRTNYFVGNGSSTKFGPILALRRRF